MYMPNIKPLEAYISLKQYKDDLASILDLIFIHPLKNSDTFYICFKLSFLHLNIPLTPHLPLRHWKPRNIVVSACIVASSTWQLLFPAMVCLTLWKGT